jgi:hypothetical protein
MYTMNNKHTNTQMLLQTSKVAANSPRCKADLAASHTLALHPTTLNCVTMILLTRGVGAGVICRHWSKNAQSDTSPGAQRPPKSELVSTIFRAACKVNCVGDAG